MTEVATRRRPRRGRRILEAVRFAFLKTAAPLLHVRVAGPLRSRLRRGSDRGLRRLPIHGRMRLEGHGLSFDYVADSRDLLGRDLFWKGLAVHESETLSLLVSRIDGRTLFIDAGAHTGLFSVIALAAGARHVLAAEPVHNIFQRLSANIEANDGTDRATILEAALGESEGEAVLFDPSGAVFASSASLLPGGWRGSGGKQVRVPVRTLDTAVDELGESVLSEVDRIVLKLDVEGLELQVLKGFSRHLREHDVSLVFEANTKEFLDASREYLEALGYTVFRIFPDRLGSAAGAEGDPAEHRGFRNYFALRNPDEALRGS